MAKVKNKWQNAKTSSKIKFINKVKKIIIKTFWKTYFVPVLINKRRAFNVILFVCLLLALKISFWVEIFLSHDASLTPELRSFRATSAMPLKGWCKSLICSQEKTNIVSCLFIFEWIISFQIFIKQTHHNINRS